MTKRIGFLPLALCLILVAAASCQQKRPAAAPAGKSARKAVTRPATEPVLSDEQRQKNVESFDVVWTTVRDKHFDPKLNGADWEGARNELRPKVEQASTMSAARAIMRELIDRLRQTHFAIIPKSAYQDLAPKSKNNGDGGIDLRLLDGRAVITRVEQNSGGADAGVRPGWELIAVGDDKVAPIIEKLNEALADSTLKDLMVSRTLVGRLHGNVGEKVAATFLDGSGKLVTVQIPMKSPSGTAANFGNLPTLYVQYEEKLLPGNFGYVYLNAFFGIDTVPRFRKSIEKFKDTDGLIIDLRGNPGGIGLMAVGMGNLLVSEENQKLGTLQMRSDKFNFVLNPQVITYTKPVVVLVDECSASTSEILAQGFRDIGRAHIIGTRTAGAALPSTVIKLPNEDGFQYAFANYTSYGGAVLEGKGVQPDEIVAPTREALLAGRDLALEAAVKWLTNQKK